MIRRDRHEPGCQDGTGFLASFQAADSSCVPWTPGIGAARLNPGLSSCRPLGGFPGLSSCRLLGGGRHDALAQKPKSLIATGRGADSFRFLSM